MAKTRFFGIHVCFAPPWAYKKRAGVYLRRPAPWVGNVAALSVPQLKACIALAEAAYAAYGKRGKAPYKGVSMPIVAVEVAKAVPKGRKVHGGLTREERSRIAHEAASARIAALRALLEAKG